LRRSLVPISSNARPNCNAPAIPLLEKAVRPSPRDPFLYLWSSRIGFAHLLQSRIDEAMVWLERSRRTNPAFSSTRLLLASACGLKSESHRAADELAEALRLFGNDRFSAVARVRINSTWNTPNVHDWFENIFLVGLAQGWTAGGMNAVHFRAIELQPEPHIAAREFVRYTCAQL
jgi:predicted Zn-dependent protease